MIAAVYIFNYSLTYFVNLFYLKHSKDTKFLFQFNTKNSVVNFFLFTLVITQIKISTTIVSYTKSFILNQCIIKNIHTFQK